VNLIPVRRNSVTHELDATGETVLYDEQNRQMYVLNDIGAAVWYLCDGTNDTDKIVSVLAERYKAGAESITRDVEEFLESLKSQGLIELKECS